MATVFVMLLSIVQSYSQHSPTFPSFISITTCQGDSPTTLGAHLKPFITLGGVTTRPVPTTGPVTTTPWGMEEDGTTVVFVRCHTHFGFINKRPGGSVGRAKHTPAQEGGHFETEATRLIVVCVVVVCVVLIVRWLRHQSIGSVPIPVGTNQHRVGPDSRCCLDWVDDSSHLLAGPDQAISTNQWTGPGICPVRSTPMSGRPDISPVGNIGQTHSADMVGRASSTTVLSRHLYWPMQHQSTARDTHPRTLSLSLFTIGQSPRQRRGAG